MFYPDNSRELTRAVEDTFADWRFGPGAQPPSLENQRIYGMISPHAGYAYSGAVAANGYYRISGSNFENVILVGPNHYGIGSTVATMKSGQWETPIGSIAVNSDWTALISKKSGILDFDNFAHSRDHCIEVQLPYLQVIRQRKYSAEFSIVPIILIMQDLDTAYDLGNAIKETVEENAEEGKTPVIIGSSDLTHYEPNEEAHRKDGELINAILSLDVNRFYAVLERLDVSACGYGAIATTMIAAKGLGATKGELLKYATSGDVTGDKDAVVGYCSIIFT
jgi:AmmeMemoRadiSam system protein B